MIVTPWLQQITRAKINPIDQCEFNMVAYNIWSSNQNLLGDLEDKTLPEVPMTVSIFDLPEFHKFINDNADNFFAALAGTDNMNVF
jgi:hypothetical protein